MGLLGSIAGSVIGGLFDRSEQKRSLKASQAQFNQQMDHSVRRRVEDAKRAGIHPLFALGASLNTSPTIMAGQSSSGSAIGDAVRNIGAAYDNYQVNKANEKANADAARLAEIKMHQEARESQARIERDKAAARLDNVEAMARLSRNAVAAQALASRNSGEGTPDQSPMHLPIVGKTRPGPHSPQQYIEDQYGGLIGEAYGLGRAVTEYGDYLGRQFIGPGIYDYNRRAHPSQPSDYYVAP